MLQVTLDKNDYIMIGDNIRIQYAKNNGKDTFAIGVAAPREVKIERKNIGEEGLELATLHRTRANIRRANQARYVQ